MSKSDLAVKDELVDALLVQVAGLLSRLIAHGEEGTIDLLGLPLPPASLATLQKCLGRGEVHVRLNACGLSEIDETRFPGVWWTQHADRDGRVISRLVEVAFVPNILRADVEEMKRGLETLLASIGAEWISSHSAA
jgi:hydrogenase-1 operon protein HyaF